MENTVKKTGPSIGSAYAWFMVLVIYIASFTGPMTQFKVAAVEHDLLEVFSMDLGTYGLLMTFFAIIGVILAVPSLFMIRNWGLKITILISVFCLGLGNLLGIFVPANASGLPLLLCTRIIEGIGLALIGVAGAAAVGIWFVPEKRGFPLGIWATWMPLGMILVFTTGPNLAASDSGFLGGGWQALWWLCLIVCVIAFILVAIFFKLPSGTKKEDIAITATVKDCFAVLKNRNIWFLGIAFFCFMFVGLGSIVNHYAEFLLIFYFDMDTTQIPAVMSFILIFLALTLVIQPLTGFISDKAGIRKPFLVASFIFLIVGVLFCFQTGNILFVWAAILIAGIGGAITGGAVRPMAPTIMHDSALGVTMGMVVLSVFMNLAMTVGPPIFGAAVDNMGGALDPTAWATVGYVLLVPLLVIALILSLLIKAK